MKGSLHKKDYKGNHLVPSKPGSSQDFPLHFKTTAAAVLGFQPCLYLNRIDCYQLSHIIYTPP